MKARLVPIAFLALAAIAGTNAVNSIGAFFSHTTARLGLLALHALLRTAVGLAFAFFTAQRSESQCRSREPVALIACAVAMLVILPTAGPNRGTPPALLLLGDAVAVAGSLLMLVSVMALGRCFGILPEARGLVTLGPYRFVRHPVYLGEIGALVGLTIAAPSVVQLLVLAVFVAAQSVRMGLEERALTQAFPEYAAYAACTGRLLPGWRRRQISSSLPTGRFEQSVIP